MCYPQPMRSTASPTIMHTPVESGGRVELVATTQETDEPMDEAFARHRRAIERTLASMEPRRAPLFLGLGLPRFE